MEKRKEAVKRETFPVLWLMAAGFLLGILIPNVIWKLGWRQKTLASVYLLETFAGRAVDEKEYFWYVVRMRGSIFLVTVLCGISVFGVPLAVLGAIFQGLEIGLLLTMSILQFGLSGGAVGAGLLLPQYLLYLPAVSSLFLAVYSQSMEIWHNRGLFPRKLSGYGMRILLAGAVYAGGILLEVYGNPWIFQLFTKNLKLF